MPDIRRQPLIAGEASHELSVSYGIHMYMSMCGLDLDMYRSLGYGYLMKDTRLIALIEAKQMKMLKAVAKREKISLAEVVRRALKAVK
jgi:hypothetical protein